MKRLLLIIIAGAIVVMTFAQEEQKGTFKLFGHVMTDAGFNFNQVNPDFSDVMRPTQLPAYKNQYGSDGTVFYSVRQSMIGIESTTPTALGDLSILFMVDLFGVGSNTGQTALHMIYAYAELGKIGAGHNWSLFCDIGCFPDMIEYWGPVGLSLCKNVQFRYIPIDGRNRLAFALERPGGTADEGVYDGRVELQDAEAKFDLPDFSAEYRMTRDWGYAEMSGLIRQIKWIDKGEQPFDVSGKAIGWGLHFSSNLKLGENNMLIAQGIVGEGIQNYMNDAPTDIALERSNEDANHPVNGVALPLKSFTLYLNHAWSKKLTSAVGYSAIFIDNTDGQDVDAFRKGQYASANLLYRPTSRITGGLELQWISRHNKQDGAFNNEGRLIESFSATKIQLSLRYSFNRLL